MQKKKSYLETFAPTLTQTQSETVSHQFKLDKQDDQLDVIQQIGKPKSQSQLNRSAQMGHRFNRISLTAGNSQILGRANDGQPFTQILPSETESTQEAPGLKQQLDQSHGGNPLPEQIRAALEPRLGSLGHVRIHTDDQASQIARSVDAQVFSYDNNIFFDAGRYDPASQEGQALLAQQVAYAVGQEAAPEEAQKGSTPQPEKDRKRGQLASRGIGSRNDSRRDDLNQSAAIQEEIEAGFEELPPKSQFMKEDVRGMFADTKDIRQGATLDCYEMSKMMLMARKDPTSIQKLFRDRGDGLYDVTINVSTQDGEKVPTIVTIDDVLPAGQNGKDFFTGEGEVTPPVPFYWAMMVEKAYAVHMNGNGRVEGGDYGRSLQLLTGDSGSTYTLDRYTDKQLISMLHHAMRNRAKVQFQSANLETKRGQLRDTVMRLGILSNRRGFTLRSVSPGSRTLSIYNPFGIDLDSIPLDRLKTFFAIMEIR
jgi:hypothetical protein